MKSLNFEFRAFKQLTYTASVQQCKFKNVIHETMFMYIREIKQSQMYYINQ